MTKSVIAYGSRAEKAADDLQDWFWGHVAKFVTTGLAISVLPFSLGMMVAPEGMSRVEKGMEATAMTHAFLWYHAGQAVSVVVPPIKNWMENGAEPTIRNN